MNKTAVISGVGPGLGASLARKFAREGCAVGLLARSRDYIESLAQELNEGGANALAVSADITQPDQVADSFAAIREQIGEADLLVNHAGNAAWKTFTELTPEEFEQSWRVCALGSFLCSQHALADMLARGSGTILFTGATSAIRGRGGASAFSSAKFAVRGLAWSLAREVGPKGIHVAHVIIDGVIDTPGLPSNLSDEPLLDPDAIAETYWSLVNQDKSAWSFEVDLRPHNEEFFT
ncbi:MAG: SDR family NAD(P)-dependent oxidoreductase [Candidatus Poribacteria bacterium]|nr:SDR family NAD(P)-dependent oxidoreductase [Candidatus Poribacteria bacterium]MDE0504814.1 SDR family NAD(P)-dependent oxidoreductase [Candidatus Poribacteria bacterium]